MYKNEHARKNHAFATNGLQKYVYKNEHTLGGQNTWTNTQVHALYTGYFLP